MVLPVIIGKGSNSDILGLDLKDLPHLFISYIEKEQKQMEVYKMCFELFRKYKHQISAITFWNISDRHSWPDNFPVRGKKDYPLLFDKDLKPKKAYWEVVKF